MWSPGNKLEEFAHGPFHGTRHFLHIEMHLRTKFLASAQESKASFIRGGLFNCGLDYPTNGTAALNSVEWVAVVVCKNHCVIWLLNFNKRVRSKHPLNGNESFPKEPLLHRKHLPFSQNCILSKSNNVDIKIIRGETLEPGPSLELNVICLG